ncbi:MAG TPA: ABC transporter permease, partial [Candidatus Polarisedimenticolaceae bacterium]|nr:ABC transporter permease [Candidatus Polarisedimenticolaceae bacterium]
MLHDLRFAARQLIHQRGFTLVALATLAIGIGATTTVFSFVDTLMLRELPYPGAERIVTLWQNNTKEGNPRDDVAPGNFFEWRERNQAFEVMGAGEPYSYDLTGVDRPEVLFAVNVTDGFFDALGVRAERGRLFAAEHFQPGAPCYAVLTHALWRGRFGGDPALVGGSLTLEDAPCTVLGVLPETFELGLLQDVARRRGLWIARKTQNWEREERDSSWWVAVGRLKPGVTLEQGQADMDRVAAALAADHPATNRGVGVSLVPLHEHLVGTARPLLLLLLAAAALVLLIACANLANLLL